MTKLYCYREVSHKTLEMSQTHTVSPTRVELNVEKLITLLYFFSLMGNIFPLTLYLPRLKLMHIF